MTSTKNDNPFVHSKLRLRRHFLDKWHGDGDIRVFDACQASGKLWTTLKKEYPVTSYWGVDIAPKKGRLRIDSARLLGTGLSENVIDIDTYGYPWRHLKSLCVVLQHAATVFLTLGQPANATSKELVSMEALRLSQKCPPLLASLAIRRESMAVLHSCLGRMSCVECQMIHHHTHIGSGAVSYFGLRLSPSLSDVA